MADDELRDSSQKTLSDDLLGIGEAAVGIVAGAALLYRSGGAKYLSEGVERTSRFISRAHSEISSRSLNDWSTDEIGNIAGGLKKAWREIGDNVKERSIGLRTEDNNSLFGMINILDRLDKNPDEYLSQMYNRSVLINPTNEYFRNNFANGDRTFENKMFEFVEGLATKLNDDVTIHDHLPEGLTDHETAVANQIFQHMSSLDSKENRHTFKEANEHILKQVGDSASSLTMLEDYFGKSSKEESVADSLLGDKAATINDILLNPDKIQEARSFRKDGRDHKFEDAIASLNRMRDKYRKMDADTGGNFEERFLALTPDAAVLRKDANGNMYSFKSAAKLFDDSLDFLAGTLPGKILKLRDAQYAKKAPLLHYIGEGETDPILASLANNVKGNAEADSHYFRILNKVYRSTSDGLEHIEEMDNTSLISGNFGARSKLLKKIMGHIDSKRSNTRLFRMFDMGQDGEPTHLQGIRSIFSKFDDDAWRGNVINRFLNPTNEQIASHASNFASKDYTYAIDYLSKARKLNSFLSKNSYELSPEAIKKLMPHVEGDEAKSILDKLMMSNDEMVNAVITRENASNGRPDRWHNHDLVSLIHSYVVNPKKALDAITLKADRARFETFGYGGGNETAKFHDLFRMELGKEMFLQHALASQEKNGTQIMHQAIVDLIENSGLRGKEKTEAKKLAHWAAFQDITGVSARTERIRSNSEHMWESISKIDELFDDRSTDSFHKEFRETISNAAKDSIAFNEEHGSRNPKSSGRRKYNSWVHIQNAVTPMDVIRSMNDEIKFKATGKKFVNQFFAGRNDPHNITNATMYPYFLLSRLSDEMNKFGIGFSQHSTGSVGQLAKNIALKRIMPVAAGLTYYNWMDDTSEQITGTSLSGAFVNGAANIDLAYRKATDAIGLTGFLKDEKAINPFTQYWFGKEEYQSYDERKDYYENGYDPVRKGRYWIFGGVNEFRGGQIAYFEPNAVRRINSNYSDKALYDGYLDKWSHSWLPTPSNPLSPLLALTDPYWLEKKHSEDRPYPVSGTLFSEGTPWGAVLNPTIGEMIKPQKRLHDDRLQDGVDTKALIYQMNKDIQTRALNKDNQNLVMLKGGSIDPVEYTAYNAPTKDERGYTMQFQGNKMTEALTADYGVYNGGVDPKTYMSSRIDDVGTPLAAPAASTELSTGEEIQLKLASGGTLSTIAGNYINSVRPKDIIRNVNSSIAARAQVNESQGIMTPEKIINLKASYGATMLDDAETVDELMNQSNGNKMIKEMAYSAKLISGIYGYIGNKTVGIGENNHKRIATSADMNSPFRSFWDSGYAGAGGEVMEIARRFMPEYKRNTRVNPLMNTMPDWLPERFRFGDPYTVVPKGEMRMPGKGYESLNKLHPDQFGEYGAFDRFKILADTAPYSPEYKIWRKIAQKTVMDPKLKDEMKQIKSRVSQQSKQHDFYDYQFIGRGVDYSNVTVTQILDRGKFKIHGSNEVYKLAGIKLKSNAQGMGTPEILSQYLHVGQQVTMAIDENKSYQKNNDKDHSVSAAVYIEGENLSRKLLDEGIAQVRKGDQSAAATVGRYSEFQQFRGKAAELLAHMDLPLIHDQWLRVRSPLESYNAEQVYGTPYQTWSDPIGTFLMPALERSVSDHVQITIGEAASIAHNAIMDIEGLGKTKRKIATGAFMLSNRGAFIGATLGYLIKPDSGTIMARGARLGSFAMTLGHLYAGSGDVLESALGFGHAGYEIAQLLGKSKLKGVMVGAAAGVALAGGANASILNGSREWVPDRTKKKWQMQEYFDRLNYIKYMGLYHKASEKAEEEEGVNVEDLVDRQERDAEKKAKLREELTATKSNIALLPESDMRKHLQELVNKKLQILQDSKVLLRTGRWTQSALLYKEAADSTMYGLKDGTTYAEIIRALPKNDREYFLEFVKERDPGKREDILNSSSPLLKRALQHTWGVQQDPMESNSTYFMNHNLPGFNWSGWRPDVDMADIQTKTISNEGMALGDYGIFESELRNPDVINAPNLDPHGQQDPLTLQANLQATLKGLGLSGVDVSVQPGPASGIQVVANVASVIGFKAENAIHDIFRLL